VLSRRERLLLFVLGWALAIAAAAVGVTLITERAAGLAGDIEAMEKQLGELQAQIAAGTGTSLDLDRMEQQIAGLRDRFYRKGEMDPYTFGVMIRDLLLETGLSIRRYQTVEVRGTTLLEFSIQGDARALMRFLRKVSNAPKQWTVSFLSIRAPREAGTVQAVFRIGYEEYDEESL
jgi:hypothetical protein